jgi:hypothetical protein
VEYYGKATTYHTWIEGFIVYYLKIVSQILIGPLSQGIAKEDNVSANATLASTLAVVRYTTILHVQMETTLNSFTLICNFF